MTVFPEGNLEIRFPNTATVRRFDDNESHGLTHCMKSVDFIVEKDDSAIFIEFKDPNHPDATIEQKEEFFNSFQSKNLNEQLKCKYRDSFLYDWTSGKNVESIYFSVLIAFKEQELPRGGFTPVLDDLK